MTAVPLEFGSLGNPGHPPLIIMHGLLGSSRNWITVGKLLAKYFNVFVLDLRNQGNSPHVDSMHYDDLVDDLVHWLEDKDIDKFYLLGHSLGGKVAMAYACRYPERLLGLIVEDMAPKEYPLRYEIEFVAMNSLNLETLKTRTEADHALEETIPDRPWRQFILTNLTRGEDNKFHWQINLKALTKWLPEIMKNPIKDSDKYEGPTLFLRGINSDFITDADYPKIRRLFPNSSIVMIEHAGHNVHIDNTEGLVHAVKEFVGGVKG